MSNVKSAITKALSDYSETCIGHWKIDGYGSDTDGAGIYWLTDSSPRNNTLETSVAPSAGFLGTAGRGTFNGTSDNFGETINALSGELQLGKDKDPSHIATVLPSIIINFGINTTEAVGTKYLVVSKGTGGANNGVHFNIPANGRPAMLWQGHTNNETVQAITTTVNDGVDHQVTYIIDRNNNKVEIYIDGSLIGGRSIAIHVDISEYADLESVGDAAFNLGKFGSTYFNAQMWNVQMYRTNMDFPASGDAGVAQRQLWVDAIITGDYLTKTAMDNLLE